MAPTLPLILLPPSEGKTAGGRGRPWAPGRMSVDLDDRRLEVVAALTEQMQASEAARSKLLGVKGAALHAATDANLVVRSSPTMTAISRYSGVLYGALDAGSLSAPARRRLGSSVLVASGLWGLVAPNDPLPDYKLKMGASLSRTGKLSTWWRDGLTDALAARAAGRVVWNLLPKEHDAAWRAAEVPARVQYSVRFLERGSDGSLTAVSHWNKFLKGALVRVLLEEPRTDLVALARWRHPMGYRLAPELTEQMGPTTVLSFVQQG